MIDWKNLSVISSRRATARDIDALSRLKAKRRKRSSGKRHATAKDIALAAQAKSAKQKNRRAHEAAVRAAYLKASREYWAGKAEAHPE